MAWWDSKSWYWFGVWRNDLGRYTFLEGSPRPEKLTEDQAMSRIFTLGRKYQTQAAEVFHWIWDEDSEQWREG